MPKGESAAVEDIEALGLPRDVEALAWDARAKLTWGDSPGDVEASLIGSGVAPPTAALIVKTCMRERAASLRAKGAQDLLVGIVGCCIGVILVAVIAVLLPEVRGRVAGVPFAGAAMAFLYGGYRLVRGLERVVFGAHAPGAVSDVDGWE